MPNLLATASQVANSLSNLKAKYIKYLESLCSSNGIDISTLKNEGNSHTLLEMYFGGLPVLVGLKYFSNLKVLKLFGQQIVCLKPLGEIAPTLEELWVCEGVIKDLTGVEHCIRLKKLYLYENSIEDANCLHNLTSLQVLDISANRLKSLQFIRHLKDLTNFSVAGNKMRDFVISTVAWPENIQHLDISGNSFSSCKPLFGLTLLPSLRSLHLNLAFSNISINTFFAWIAHSFRYLESIDDDRLSDMFITSYRPMIDTIFAEKISRIAKIEEKYTKDVRLAEKHSTKIENRLGCLAEALAVFRDSMQTKDAKKEIVKRVQEICSNNSKAVKSVKKNYNILCDYHRALSKYKIACEMESCQTFELRDSTEEEISTLTQILNYNCSMKNCYEITMKSCSIVNEVSKTDSEKLFILEKDCNDCLFDVRSIFQLLDRYNRSNYMLANNPVKIVRDFEIIKKQAKDKTIVFFLPLVSSKMSKGGSKIDEDGLATSHLNETNWKDIRLCAVLAVEIHPSGQITTDQLRFMDKFEESWAEQLKKLSDMNIRLDIKDERRKKSEETTEASIETINNQTSKVRKVSDLTSNIKSLSGRISDEKVVFDWFSTRNPLDIMLAYFDCSKIIKDTNDLSMRITVVDMSEQKLTKLAGIQELVNLQFLSLRKNKLTSLKKLNRLPLLKLIDASCNHIAKLETLPTSLLYVDLSSNRLQNLAFCPNLANCRQLKVQKNQIKSMKGLEMCTQVEVLYMNENLVKDRNEIDVLKNMTKLTHLDLSLNPISQMDGYKSKIMQISPFLISFDRQLIPVEERHVSTSKQASRGLSLELIDRISPEWKSKQELMIVDQKIEQIILEKSQLEELSHIRLMDLSKNKLSSVREIQSLSITHLEISYNSIKNIAMVDGQMEVFRNLENLNVSNNSITNTSLIRLGLNLLQKLKHIDLSANCLNKLDCNLFDLPCLESIDLSNNLLKTIVRKPLKNVTNLYLQNNRLSTLSPLSCPNLIVLNISNNKLASCASLKPLCEAKSLRILDCRNNSVTERRVYVDFIRSQVPSVEQLDDEKMCEEVEMTKRKLSKANDMNLMSRRSSMVTSSMLSWFEKQEETLEYGVPRASSFLEPSRKAGIRLEPIKGRKINDSEGFTLFGTKVLKHAKK